MNAQLNPVPSALDAYREAAATRDAILARSRELQQRIAALQPLQDKRDAAQADLDQIIADEAIAIAEWAKAGAQGPAPTPDAKARDKAAKALADAEHGLVAAGAAKASIASELLGVNAEIPTAQAAVHKAQAEVMGEEWLRGHAARYEAVTQMQVEDERLSWLYRAMFEAHGPTAARCVGIEQAREVERINRPNTTQTEGTTAFENWCAETFGDQP